MTEVELHAEVKRLTAVLERIAYHGCEDHQCSHTAPVAVAMRRMAREALGIPMVYPPQEKDASCIQ